MHRRGRRQKDGGRKRGAEGLGTAASLLMGTRARDGGGRQNRGKNGLTTQENQRPEIRLETRRFLGRRPEFLVVCRVVQSSEEESAAYSPVPGNVDGPKVPGAVDAGCGLGGG